MFLIYTLERSDILPVDDYGVREGYRRLKSLDKTPTPRQMRDIGLAWSPHRTVAAWYLWRLPAQGVQPPGDPSEHRPGMHSHAGIVAMLDGRNWTAIAHELDVEGYALLPDC